MIGPRELQLGNLPATLEAHAARSGWLERAALLTSDEVITHGMLYDLAARTAGVRLGVVPDAFIPESGRRRERA